MKDLFRKPTAIAVAVFIVGMLLMLAYCEDAEANPWSLEWQHDSNAGSTAFNSGLDRLCARGTFPAGTSAYICPLGAVGGDLRSDSWELGITEPFGRWEGEIRLNSFDGVIDGGGTVRRMIGDGPFRLGLGLTYWINESPGSNSDVTFNLAIRYTWGE